MIATVVYTQPSDGGPRPVQSPVCSSRIGTVTAVSTGRLEDMSNVTSIARPTAVEQTVAAAMTALSLPAPAAPMAGPPRTALARGGD